MARRTVRMPVLGPWSLDTCRAFWEGFTPAALGTQSGEALRTVFRVEADWSRATAAVTQDGAEAVVTVEGDGDLDAAAEQVARFLALDVDARAWPDIGDRDPVIGDAQRRLPGLRPCGFHSPYEAAGWAVLSQRFRIPQAAALRAELVRAHGEDGAFPAPATLRSLDLDLPGRKTEYLHAVADAALDGRLDATVLRSTDPQTALDSLRTITGIGPFAAEHILLRGANAPDVLPTTERRFEAEIVERYGPDRSVTEIAEAWRPLRTWAVLHLRVLREQRTNEISGRSG